MSGIHTDRLGHWTWSGARGQLVGSLVIASETGQQPRASPVAQRGPGRAPISWWHERLATPQTRGMRTEKQDARRARLQELEGGKGSRGVASEDKAKDAVELRVHDGVAEPKQAGDRQQDLKTVGRVHDEQHDVACAPNTPSGRAKEGGGGQRP